MTSFNGTYTIQNQATGEHRTFSVRTQPDDAKFAPKARIAALLTGPDNENSYTGFGFVNADGIYVWKSKRSAAFEHYANILWLAIQGLQGDEETLTGSLNYKGRTYSVTLSKRCLRCNRKLTTPESIKRGIGPECAQILATKPDWE